MFAFTQKALRQFSGTNVQCERGLSIYLCLFVLLIVLSMFHIYLPFILSVSHSISLSIIRSVVLCIVHSIYPLSSVLNGAQPRLQFWESEILTLIKTTETKLMSLYDTAVRYRGVNTPPEISWICISQKINYRCSKRAWNMNILRRTPASPSSLNAEARSLLNKSNALQCVRL